MRGDINAVELYQDREFLVRVGYGIYDVPVGSTGGVGFEDVRRFSYLEAEEEDPKMYRRKVFNLVGRYYQNDLARALWSEFNKYHRELNARNGYEVTLEEAALKWLDQYGHDFFKAWTLRQAEVPFRMWNREEPTRSYLDMAVQQVAPQWRELIDSGFDLFSIVLANLMESTPRRQRLGQAYLRLVARLSGHRIGNQAEAERRAQEVAQLESHLTHTLGRQIGRKAATIEYYRRLNLLAEIEGYDMTSTLAGATA